MVLRLNASHDDFAPRFAAFLAVDRDGGEDVAGRVADILASVRRDGFTAVAALTATFDGFDVKAATAAFTPDERARAMAACDSADLEALRFAADRIRAYHEKQLPADHFYTDDNGVGLGWRWTPVETAGLYAPGGRASYPSSVLMNAVPARVAGVNRLVCCAPAPGGEINPLVLAAADIAGVDDVYRVGGAQAIAAMAYGAGPIPAVDVVVGPGNAYVAEAKRQVFGRVGVDSIAGPSEILVVADGDNDPQWIAADLLSQAEHDPSSQSVLITDDPGFADAVTGAVEEQIAASPRRAICEAAWRDNSAVIVVDDLASAPALVDRIAPEHLELAVKDPHDLAKNIRHAGAIFLGRYAPEAVGDYVAGPDHVLPTGGGARFNSGLSVLSFMKRTSLIACGPEGLAAIGPAAARPRRRRRPARPRRFPYAGG